MNLIPYALVLGAIALSLGLLKELSAVIAPTFLAVNLLIASFPVYTALVKRRTPGPVAAIVTGLVVLLVFVASLGAIVWSGTAMVQSLTAYGPQFTSLYNQFIDWLAGLGFDQTALVNQLKSISPTSVIGVVGNVVSEISKMKWPHRIMNPKQPKQLKIQRKMLLNRQIKINLRHIKSKKWNKKPLLLK